MIFELNSVTPKQEGSKEKFVVKPGDYNFVVKQVMDKIDKNGNNYVNIMLEVDIGTKFMEKCFVNIWNRPDFKDRRNGVDTLKNLLTTVGLTEDLSKLDTKDLVGKSGKASFTTEQWKQYTNLKYDKGCENDHQEAPQNSSLDSSSW